MAFVALPAAVEAAPEGGPALVPLMAELLRHGAAVDAFVSSPGGGVGRGVAPSALLARACVCVRACAGVCAHVPLRGYVVAASVLFPTARTFRTRIGVPTYAHPPLPPAVPSTLQSASSQTALHLAVRRGDVVAARWLLQQVQALQGWVQGRVCVCRLRRQDGPDAACPAGGRRRRVPGGRSACVLVYGQENLHQD